MTFQFDNYENQPVGSQPDGWNVIETTDKFEITDLDPLFGSRSFVVTDETSGVPKATNDAWGTEDLEFSLRLRNQQEFSSGRLIRIQDKSQNFTVALHNTDNESFVNVSYVLGDSGENPGNVVHTIDIGQIYQFALRDVGSSMKIEFDGSVVYDTGDSWSPSGLRMEWDDFEMYHDAPGGKLSDFCFESGKAWRLEGASQGYVYEGGDSKEAVNDDGTSNYVFLSGTGIGRES